MKQSGLGNGNYCGHYKRNACDAILYYLIFTLFGVLNFKFIFTKLSISVVLINKKSPFLGFHIH